MTSLIVVNPDNFTPKTRTPWAGTFISRNIKDRLLPQYIGFAVGESWEFSCDPSFASKVSFPENLEGKTVQEVIETYPKQLLSPSLSKGLGLDSLTCEILVKLVNADQNLSLQVHPEDNNEDLAEDECGKPESWYILHAEKGAGIYLGFSEAIAMPELRKRLAANDRCEELLQFVPVSPGDYFEIPPGVPHSIGAGVTILEPQRVLKGKSGKTYRMWDWGRQYDSKGNLVEKGGAPRQLHLSEAMKLVNSEKQIGIPFVNELRKMPSEKKFNDSIALKEFPANDYYQVFLIDCDNSSGLGLQLESGFAIAVMLNGTSRVFANQQEVEVNLFKGNTSMIGFESFPLQLHMGAQSKLALILPCDAGLKMNNE